MKELLGQIETFQPLMQFGVLGVVLGWLMWRMDSRMGQLAHRIDGLTRALLMDMVNRDNVGVATKTYAREAIAKIEARNGETRSPM